MSQKLSDFYEFVQSAGKLRTPEHAQLWSRAALQTLGLNLNGGAKKALKAALPDELAQHISGVWWIFNFRDTNMTATLFQDRVGRRAGNTDITFARYPTQAVFGGLRNMLNSNVAKEVADSLSPELRELWDKAPVA